MYVPPHDILVLMAYATNEGSDWYAHLYSLARVFTVWIYKVWFFGLNILNKSENATLQ